MTAPRPKELAPAAEAAIVPFLPQERFLTRAEYQRLSEVPSEAEWFANLQNKHTRRA